MTLDVLRTMSNKIFPVVIALWFHLFPFRTEKLSTVAPMVLHTRGRVGRRHFPRALSSIRIRSSFFVRFRNHLLYVLEVKKPSCIDGTALHYPLALESRLFFEICSVYVLSYSSAIRYQECSMSFFYKCMCYECRIFVHTFLFMVIHCQRI